MLDRDLFAEALATERSRTTMTAEELTHAITRACDVAMPRKQAPRNGRKPAYWWNEDISAKRTECVKARRIAQRTRRRENANEYREIKAGKRACFKELCREADTNLWGSAYRIMIKKKQWTLDATRVVP